MRKHRSNGGRRKFTLPVAVVLGFMPLVGTSIDAVRKGGWNNLKSVVPALIPYDPATRQVTFAKLHLGLWPILAGIIVHKFVGGMFGVNRALARAGVPWIRI